MPPFLVLRLRGRRERRLGIFMVLGLLCLFFLLYSYIYLAVESSLSIRNVRKKESRRHRPYYQRWDHTTHTLRITVEDRHDRDKATSLELLQEIIHSDSSPSSSTPSCFAPNVEETQKFAERVQSSSASLGLPLLNLGFPKSGSSTLRTFLRRQMGWHASHYSLHLQDDEDGQVEKGDDATASNKSITVGERMMKAADQGLSPFAFLSSAENNYRAFHAHTQLDYTGQSHNYFPQIQLLDEIHMAEPNSTFVLLFRPIEDWIRSTQSWHWYPIRWANSDVDLPDLGSILTPQQIQARNERDETIVLTAEQLEAWWCLHVRHVRKFVETYPSHNLIELDLYDKNRKTSELLRKLFGLSNENNKSGLGGSDDTTDKEARNSTVLWSTANRNPLVKEKRPGPVSMRTHYYQLWNHSTHSLNYLDRTTRDRFFGSDLPTSLELLQQVMKDETKSKKQKEESCFRPSTISVSLTAASKNVSFPILHVGLPLLGNDFLKNFFRSCMGLHATSKKVSGGGLVGKKMMEAVHAGLPPISGYFGQGRDAFVQLDYTAVLPNTASSKFEEVNYDNGAQVGALPFSAFPQIQLLDEIHEDVPDATFILPFRSGRDGHDPIQGWIDLAQNFHNFTERWAAMEDVPGLVLTTEQRLARQDDSLRGPEEPMLPLKDHQLREWWCRHVRHIREFVRHYPSHALLEVNLQDPESAAAVLLQSFPQADTTCLPKLLNETNFL